nr:hypothetical protein Iba_chr13bCG2700 [Ipomoea batatas]
MDSEKACNSDELDLWGFSGGDTLDIDGKTDKDDGGPTVLEDIPEGAATGAEGRTCAGPTPEDVCLILLLIDRALLVRAANCRRILSSKSESSWRVNTKSVEN